MRDDLLFWYRWFHHLIFREYTVASGRSAQWSLFGIRWCHWKLRCLQSGNHRWCLCQWLLSRGERAEKERDVCFHSRWLFRVFQCAMEISMPEKSLVSPWHCSMLCSIFVFVIGRIHSCCYGSVFTRARVSRVLLALKCLDSVYLAIL